LWFIQKEEDVEGANEKAQTKKIPSKVAVRGKIFK